MLLVHLIFSRDFILLTILFFILKVFLWLDTPELSATFATSLFLLELISATCLALVAFCCVTKFNKSNDVALVAFDFGPSSGIYASNAFLKSKFSYPRGVLPLNRITFGSMPRVLTNLPDAAH